MSTTAQPSSVEEFEPFVGLQPFTEAQARFFFGRESERRLLIASMIASRLTLLYGESGAGKSSLLRAGVLHELRKEERRQLEEHRFPESVVVFFNSWRDDPCADLATSIQEAVDELLGANAPSPPRPSERLDEVIAGWNRALDRHASKLAQEGDVEFDLPPRTELFIILDQFEQYFLYHADDEGDGTFAVEFPRAVNRDDLRVSFLISLREDAYARLDRFEGRILNIFGNNFRIEHLDHSAARRAIEGPLEQLNREQDAERYKIEQGLIRAVLGQVPAGSRVLGQAGGGVVEGAESAELRVETPYLQLVMTRLWKEESRRWEKSPSAVRSMRLKTLDDLGGAQQIVRTHLDDVMSELAPLDRDIAAQVLNQLVTPSGSRIVHKLKDLANYADVEEDELQAILSQLDGLRILRSVDPAPGDPSPRFEIRHDVLASAVVEWQRAYQEGKDRAEEAKGLEERRLMTRASAPPSIQLDSIQAALASADMDGVRRALLELATDEQRLLTDEIGSGALGRARRVAAGPRRRGKLGKVVFVPGFMGTELDVVEHSGDADRVWLNLPRLIRGRLGDLALGSSESPLKPGVQVRTSGVHRKTYLSMLMELDVSWHVRPFAYDWRVDLDRSAARLDEVIREFGAGEPVHIVAHSTGGLVARRFARRFPNTWNSMHDPREPARGGRLIMLGTPNRGFFSVPLMLTGAEGVVQLLARADLQHSLGEIVAIFASFPGLYQMLPSPLVDLDDDHTQLFDKATWGAFAIRQPVLNRARSFLTDLDDVLDPQRLIYVSGFGRPTPVRIRVDAPGRFSYRVTQDGDGLVPHVLGLLEGVPTYWVGDSHGDLAGSPAVLDCVSELLEIGETSTLMSTRPLSKGVARGRWLKGEEVGPLAAEAEAVLSERSTELGQHEAARIENLVLAGYLGSGGEHEPSPPPPAEPPRGRRAPTIRVEVVWGEITRADGDVYAVGHYEGVLPHRAELALDMVVSGVTDTKTYDRQRLVITEHARRGTLRGVLGDVSFFPWGEKEHAGRQVAVVGMGRPGTLDAPALRRLVHGFMVAVSSLPSVRTVCTVLIGSGEGSLTIREAVRAYVDGIADAAEGIGADSGGMVTRPFPKLVFVEHDRGHAEEILDALTWELESGAGVAREQSVTLDLYRRLRRASGGTVSVEEAVARLADALVAAAGAAKSSRQGRALAALLDETGGDQTVRRLALQSLRRAGEAPALPGRPQFRVTRREPVELAVDFPTRIAFWDDGRIIRAAGISAHGVVPERIVAVGRDILESLIEKTIDPPQELVAELSDLLYRFLIPTDFRHLLNGGSLVVEIDRSMARVPWEMLATGRADGVPPISVSRPVARQHRMTHSQNPTPPRRAELETRALVIGDPGDLAEGYHLPGARSEALKVKELLESQGDVVVEARIGAPKAPRVGPLHGVRPADRLEVLSLLARGGFDLIHYAGMADLDPNAPDRAGWLFADGLLTPRDIGRLDPAPSLIFSNASFSARTATSSYSTSEALLPSLLAQEFFDLGVRNYIGAAWEVSDIGAEVFAREFYGALGAGESFGEAVRAAREALWRSRDTFGALWAAYQHYGDPTSDSGLASRA